MLIRPFSILLTCLIMPATAQDVLRVPEPAPRPELYRLPESGDEILPSFEAYFWEVHEKARALYFGPKEALPEGVTVQGRQLFVQGRLRPDLVPLPTALVSVMSRMVDGDMTFETALLNRGFDLKDFPWLMKATGELSITTFFDQRITEREDKYWLESGRFRTPTKQALGEWCAQFQDLSRETKLIWAKKILERLSNPSRRALISFLLEKTVHSLDVGFNIGPYTNEELELYRQYIVKKTANGGKKK